MQYYICQWGQGCISKCKFDNTFLKTKYSLSKFIRNTTNVFHTKSIIIWKGMRHTMARVLIRTKRDSMPHTVDVLSKDKWILKCAPFWLETLTVWNRITTSRMCLNAPPPPHTHTHTQFLKVNCWNESGYISSFQRFFDCTILPSSNGSCSSPILMQIKLCKATIWIF